MSRTFATNAKAYYWQTFEGIYTTWYDFASKKLFETRLDADPPRAARVYALMAVTHHDASVACWDAKYTYWAIRPFQLDAAVNPLFATPNHPSYPAAHACYSVAIARVLGYLFPRDAEFIAKRAEEAMQSRFWAGIHFPSDNEAGAQVGRAVADRVIERARRDGAH